MSDAELQARLAEYNDAVGTEEWQGNPHYIHSTGEITTVADEGHPQHQELPQLTPHPTSSPPASESNVEDSPSDALWEKVLLLESAALRHARQNETTSFVTDINEEMRAVLGIQLTPNGVDTVPVQALMEEKEEEKKEESEVEPGNVINYIRRVSQTAKLKAEEEAKLTVFSDEEEVADPIDVATQLAAIHQRDALDTEAMSRHAEQSQRRLTRRSPSAISSHSSSSSDCIFSSNHKNPLTIPSREILKIEVDLVKATPPHLTAAQAKYWQSSEKARLVQQRKVDLYEKRLAEQKARYKEELKGKAAQRQQKGGASFCQKTVSEHLQRQREKTLQKSDEDKNARQKELDDRKERLSLNRNSFAQAQKNNEIRRHRAKVHTTAPTGGGYSGAAVPTSVVATLASPPISPQRGTQDNTFVTNLSVNAKEDPKKKNTHSDATPITEGTITPPLSQRGPSYKALHNERMIRDQRREKEKENRAMQSKHAADELASRRLQQEEERLRRKRAKDAENSKQRHAVVEEMKRDKERRLSERQKESDLEKEKHNAMREAFAKARRASSSALK